MALSQAKSWSEDSLKDLSRRELQKVAKNLGVRGNMKSTDIISEILATISGSTQGDTAGCGRPWFRRGHSFVFLYCFVKSFLIL